MSFTSVAWPRALVREASVPAAQALNVDLAIGDPANVLAGHFVWHDVFTEITRVTGSPCRLVHKPLAQMTDEGTHEPALLCPILALRRSPAAVRLGFPPQPDMAADGGRNAPG